MLNETKVNVEKMVRSATLKKSVSSIESANASVVELLQSKIDDVASVQEKFST